MKTLRGFFKAAWQTNVILAQNDECNATHQYQLYMIFEYDPQMSTIVSSIKLTTDHYPQQYA